MMASRSWGTLLEPCITKWVLGQCIELGALDEVGGLLGVGQHLLAGHGSVGAVAVFLVALHGFQAAQATQFALDGDTRGMRHLHHLAGHFDVVFVAGNGFAVALQAAVHHDGTKAQINGTLAHFGVLPMVLVHDQWNVGVGFNGRLNQVLDEGFARIFACARAGLQNDRGANFIGSLHNRLNLLQIVHVKGRNTVAISRGMVQQFAHRYECHFLIS